MSTRRLRTLLSVVATALALGTTACGGDPPGDVSQGPAPGATPTTAAAASVSARSAAAAGISPAQQAANEQQARADLAADIDQRIAYARWAFGKEVPLRVESGLFVIVAAEKGVAFDTAADFAQRALDVYLGSFFARRPDRAVTVELVRSASAFRLRCAQHSIWTCRDTDLGAYSRSGRTIVVNIGPGLPSMSHELVHPLVQTDFPRIPEWLDEGIGALFEKPAFDAPGEMHGADNWRYERLVRAVHAAERAKAQPLPELFANGDALLDGSGRDTIYAEARALCQWLDERGQLWAFYRAWRENVTDDPTGEKSFAQVTGMTPPDADATWLEWAKARRWK